MLRSIGLTCLLLGLGLCTNAQMQNGSQQIDAQEPAAVQSGSISGRVTVEGAAAAGVLVVLVGPSGRTAIARMKTDRDGQYRFENLKAGSYDIEVDGYGQQLAPMKVSPSTVLLDAGQNAENIDFQMVLTGSISGRVVDAAGRPVVGASVYAGWSPGHELPAGAQPDSAMTDERGMYRIFGVPAGHYEVSVSPRFSVLDPTYYPGVRDREKGSVIEVVTGKEIGQIDIVYKSPVTKTGFSISGRVVDSETGDPVSAADCDATAERENPGAPQTIVLGKSYRGQSDSTGYFHIENVEPGKYSLFADQKSQGYSDDAEVTVADRDITSVLIKYHPGVAISGTIIIESDDPSVLAQLKTLKVSGGHKIVSEYITPDGSFSLTGINPNPNFLTRLSVYSDSGKFSIDRAELNGAPIGKVTNLGTFTSLGDLNFPPGENLTGLRVFVTYNDGTIRGQVNVTGGSLPVGATLQVLLDPTEQQMKPHMALLMARVGGAEPDVQGRFVIHNLKPGSHQVTLMVWGLPSSDIYNSLVPATVSEEVNVTNGTESEVTLVLDLTPKNSNKR